MQCQLKLPTCCSYLDLMSSINISYGVNSYSVGEWWQLLFFSLTPRRSSSTTCIQNLACKQKNNKLCRENESYVRNSKNKRKNSMQKHETLIKMEFETFFKLDLEWNLNERKCWTRNHAKVSTYPHEIIAQIDVESRATNTSSCGELLHATLYPKTWIFLVNCRTETVAHNLNLSQIITATEEIYKLRQFPSQLCVDIKCRKHWIIRALPLRNNHACIEVMLLYWFLWQQRKSMPKFAAFRLHQNWLMTCDGACKTGRLAIKCKESCGAAAYAGKCVGKKCFQLSPSFQLVCITFAFEAANWMVIVNYSLFNIFASLRNEQEISLQLTKTNICYRKP